MSWNGQATEKAKVHDKNSDPREPKRPPVGLRLNVRIDFSIIAGKEQGKS